ncbi:MAG: PQQ-like beta-propeller repeat protein [Acidobacteria bacterium]|nr:PQQ-like beta-propeller repeat protein [Acidobacteriota bacterium]
MLSILLLAASAFAADHNWPQFRGLDANGAGSGTPPVEWNGESGKNVLWKTAIPGLGYSSPVIWGDRIYLTSAVSAGGSGAAVKLGLYGDITSVPGEGKQDFNVYCIDRKSGKILWTRTAFSGEPQFKRHPKSSHANPTPATDGKHLVVFFGSEGLYTYDMNGKLLWKKDLGKLDSGFFRVPEAQWGFASSPVLHDGMVIVQADVQKDSFVASFDVKTGKELWRTGRTDVPTFGTPAVVPGANGAKQVVVNGWKQIAGYDLKTGKQIWHMAGAGDIPVPTPLFDNGLIVVTNAHGPGRPIFAIRNTAEGEITNKPEALAWKQDRAGNYMQTPLLHGGIGYFCFDNGVLTTFQLSTGERLYQQRLGAGSSGFTSSPVAAADRLYITNEEGHTYVVKLGNQYQLLGENDLGEQVMASGAISNGVLFLRGRGHLWALGEKR